MRHRPRARSSTTTGEVITRRFTGRAHEVLAFLLELAPPARVVYEAGPTGYGLARRGRAAGIDVQVCAPGMIQRAGSERIKTDKRDAIKLARLHAAGQLVLVYVPTLEQEQRAYRGSGAPTWKYGARSPPATCRVRRSMIIAQV
jgi:transposase